MLLFFFLLCCISSLGQKGLLHHLSLRPSPTSCSAGYYVASLQPHHFVSACTSASHLTPLAPLVQLAVALPLITPPPPICLRLRLSLHPSHASCPAGCRVASHHTAASHGPVPLHLIAPLLRLLSGWLFCHLLSCRCLPSACAFNHLHSSHHHQCCCHHHPHHCYHCHCRQCCSHLCHHHHCCCCHCLH
jgi:hypothetical protein